MAESKGDKARDERADDSALDEAASDEVVEKSGKTITKSKSDAKKKDKKSARKERRNPLAVPIRFVREVVAELRKVIWPTRKELVTYATVVIVFVVVMVSIVAGLDYGLAKAVLYLFGDPNADTAQP